MNSPSLPDYQKRQRWIRGSIRLITGVLGVLYYVFLASLSHLDTIWTHFCQHLYENSPSLSDYQKRQRWIRRSPRQIPGVLGVLHNVYLASLSHLGPVWTHLCQIESIFAIFACHLFFIFFIFIFFIIFFYIFFIFIIYFYFLFLFFFIFNFLFFLIFLF